MGIRKKEHRQRREISEEDIPNMEIKDIKMKETIKKKKKEQEKEKKRKKLNKRDE